MKQLAKYAKRSDNFAQIAFALERGRLVSFTIPRDLSDEEVQRIVETIAYEVSFDRHLFGRCAKWTREQREAVN